MKKNGAIWVALIVLVVAALLMFFVVLPQVRGSKTAEELAEKAAETAGQVKEKAGKTLDKATEVVVEAAKDPKAGVLEKMSRAKADGEAATVEFEALFAGGKQPSVEQLAAARAKLEAALKAASDITAPEGLDTQTASLISQTSAGAKKALDALKAMPADIAGAKAAYEGMKASVMAVLGTGEAKTVAEPAKQEVAKVQDVKPADNAGETKPVDATQTKPADAQPAEPADAMVPTFDVLRVEKDGSTVIAGKSVPGAKVDIVDGDKVIASTEAGDSGDFVAVLDNPLPAGDHQLVLQSAAKDGTKAVSAEVATVSVPADKSGELLAMVTKPGEASRIMEMPKAGKEATVAANTGDKAVKPADTTKTDEAKTAEEPAVMPAQPDASADLAKTAPTTGQEAQKAENTGAAASDQVAASDAASTATEKPVEKAAKPEVLVSAVEIEGDKIFVAGSTRPKSVVRVYADDKLVAEVSADDKGRFVADNSQPLSVGNHTIRADVLSTDGKRVEFRASVPFFRPEGAQLAAVANEGATDKQEMQPLADGAYDKAREEAGKAIALLKGLYVSGRTPTLDELAAARSATEIALKTLSQIKLSDAEDSVAREMASKTAGKAAEALKLLKSLPQDANAVKTALNSIDDAVTSAVGPSMETATAAKPAMATDNEKVADNGGKPASAEIADTAGKPADAAKSADSTTTAAATTASKAESTSQALAKQGAEIAAKDGSQPKVIEQAPLKPSETSVIIRRGDTLWQISRRVYGRGVRYTTIYLANEDQINDPDRIMPGQIFGVPEKYLPNAEELHRERMDHRKQ